jgi:hypothetical protein
MIRHTHTRVGPLMLAVAWWLVLESGTSRSEQWSRSVLSILLQAQTVISTPFLSFSPCLRQCSSSRDDKVSYSGLEFVEAKLVLLSWGALLAQYQASEKKILVQDGLHNVSLMV